MNINKRLKQLFIMREKSSTNVHFASALTRLMDEKKLDNTQVARAIDVTPTAVGNYKNGRVPRAEELLKLARFFSVSMESLLTGMAKPSAGDASWKLRAIAAEQKVESLKAAVTAAVSAALKKF